MINITNVTKKYGSLTAVDNISLEITFAQDGNEWNHYCDLVYTFSGESFDMLSGYGIDSPLNLVDTIMDLCKEY